MSDLEIRTLDVNNFRYETVTRISLHRSDVLSLIFLFGDISEVISWNVARYSSECGRSSELVGDSAPKHSKNIRAGKITESYIREIAQGCPGSEILVGDRAHFSPDIWNISTCLISFFSLPGHPEAIFRIEQPPVIFPAIDFRRTFQSATSCQFRAMPTSWKKIKGDLSWISLIDRRMEMSEIISYIHLICEDWLESEKVLFIFSSANNNNCRFHYILIYFRCGMRMPVWDCISFVFYSYRFTNDDSVVESNERQLFHRFKGITLMYD